MKKILIVDDLKMNLDIGKSVFSQIDCQLFTAGNGLEALEVTRNIKPDLIILDLYMPEMNGDECCRLIKEDAWLSHIPVLMLNAGGSIENEEKCFAAGCDDFMAKPYKSADLMKKVASHIDIMVRKSTRVSIHTPASFRVNNNDLSAYIHDLSTGGTFIESNEPLAIGTVLDIEFTIPDREELIEVQGEVKWSIDDPAKCSIDNVPGMGINFLDISQESKNIIADYVRDVEAKQKDLPQRRERRTYKSDEYAVIDAFTEFFGDPLPKDIISKICE